MTTAKRELKLKNYVDGFNQPQQPKKRGFYLVDWGDCDGVKGARYALIEGESMEQAFWNLDGAIHFDDNVKVKPLNSEEIPMSSCYIELCDLNETKFNILNDDLNLTDDECDALDEKHDDDREHITEWVSAKDFYLLPENIREKL